MYVNTWFILQGYGEIVIVIVIEIVIDSRPIQYIVECMNALCPHRQCMYIDCHMSNELFTPETSRIS